jgi:hypothetical protein
VAKLKLVKQEERKPGEPIRVIDPADGFHKALEKLTPKQMARLIARISANVPPLKAKTPSEETPPRRAAASRRRKAAHHRE